MRAILGVLLLIAQATTSFDVVSIKPGRESADNPFRRWSLQNNRWTATRLTVREVIERAYQTDGFDMPDRVVGGPKWLDEDQFDIVATSTSTPTQAQLEVMLRAMLADRFHLVSHFEKRTLPAYELSLARRDGALGGQLHRAVGDCAPRCGVTGISGPPIYMRSGGVDMKGLAYTLSTSVLKQPVIDRTGLTGLFELEVEFAPGTELAAPPPSDAPSIFTALEEQLGLKLKSVKTPLDVLIVDRADKPTLN